jgi:hypothetical protein
MRRRRSAPLRQMIETVFARQGKVSILDVGGMENYWSLFSPEFYRDNNVTITLSNLAKDIRPIERPEIFHAHTSDGCVLPYDDNQFDISHSNSVIEHVGDWSRKTAYADEVRRIAPCYFHQTPNFWFPWEPHHGVPFYHWLPQPTQLWITRNYKMAWPNTATDTVADGMVYVEHASMLNRPMVKHLFPDATIIVERFAGLPKSFIALRDAA